MFEPVERPPRKPKANAVPSSLLWAPLPLTSSPYPDHAHRRFPIAARLLLLAALAAAGAAAQPAAEASCPALADTPLDPNVSSWTFTLYVPPALVPALLDPSSPSAAASEQALDAAFTGGAITPNL